MCSWASRTTRSLRPKGALYDEEAGLACRVRLPGDRNLSEGWRIFVVRVAAASQITPGLCGGVRWQDNLVFYNSNSFAATVRLLEVTNGGPRPDATPELAVPAGSAINGAGRVNWSPRTSSPIWVNKLDVADGVAVKSRVEAHWAGCGGIPPSVAPDFGAFSLPVVHALSPAGTTQVHLGADLGAQLSNVNVGIYNDGVQNATAEVALRQVCDNTVRETQSVIVPPKTLVQVGGLGSTGTQCPTPGSEFNAWMRYVTVTLNEPGFSYIVNRSAEIPDFPLIPVIPFAAP